MQEAAGLHGFLGTFQETVNHSTVLFLVGAHAWQFSLTSEGI